MTRFTRFVSAALVVAALPAFLPATGDIPQRYVFDVRVIEVHLDGTESEATRIEEEVPLDEVANLYVWWGKHDAAGGLLEPVGEAIAADQPLLGDSAWACVWQVQGSVKPKAGSWSVGVRLNKAEFGGLGENGRPAYTRRIQRLSYVPAGRDPQRWEMFTVREERQIELGITRVLLELRVVPAEG